MRCDENMQRFLELENSRYLPASIRMHMLLCPGCRKEIHTLQKAFMSFRRTSAFVMPEEMKNAIMLSVKNSQVTYEKNVSSIKWLFVGTMLFASILLIPYSDSLIWLKVQFGRDLEIPLNIVLGFLITLYSVSFIGSHLDSARELIAFIEKKIR